MAGNIQHNQAARSKRSGRTASVLSMESQTSFVGLLVACYFVSWAEDTVRAFLWSKNVIQVGESPLFCGSTINRSARRTIDRPSVPSSTKVV